MITREPHRQPHRTVKCQYRNVPNIAWAPCAKLKIPEVLYVSTSPDAAMEYTEPRTRPRIV